MSYQIKEGKISDVEKVYLKMKEDFDEKELKTVDQMKDLMETNRYKLIFLVSEEQSFSNGYIGYMFLSFLDNQNAIWLEYVAIADAFRGEGYGSIFLNEIIKKYKASYRYLFLEVEKPTIDFEKAKKIDDFIEIMKHKRIKFYTRFGAVHLVGNYQLPTPHKGFPMALYLIDLEGPPSKVAHNIYSDHKDDINNIQWEYVFEVIEQQFDLVHYDIENKNQYLDAYKISVKEILDKL